MPLPGFTAPESLYRASGHYVTGGTLVRSSAAGEGVVLAYSCSCTDPNCKNPTTTCTCDCELPDPCGYCLSIRDRCARAKCMCTCNDGIIMPNQTPPCYFRCSALR